jgi:hypothetical protein
MKKIKSVVYSNSPNLQQRFDFGATKKKKNFPQNLNYMHYIHIPTDSSEKNWKPEMSRRPDRAGPNFGRERTGTNVMYENYFGLGKLHGAVTTRIGSVKRGLQGWWEKFLVLSFYWNHYSRELYSYHEVGYNYVGYKIQSLEVHIWVNVGFFLFLLWPQLVILW